MAREEDINRILRQLYVHTHLMIELTIYNASKRLQTMEAGQLCDLERALDTISELYTEE